MSYKLVKRLIILFLRFVIYICNQQNQDYLKYLKKGCSLISRVGNYSFQRQNYRFLPVYNWRPTYYNNKWKD